MSEITGQPGLIDISPFSSSLLDYTKLFEDSDDDVDDDEDHDEDDPEDDDGDDPDDEVYDLENFNAILSKNYFILPRGDWVFRGHSSESFELISKVGRGSHTSRTRGKFESSIFDMFKRSAVQYLEKAPRNDWEWLAIAQHHGLPTRLLDWSFNPFVALYFAVEDRLDEDGVVYALNAPKKLPQKIIETASPFKIKKPMKFLPNIVAPRLWEQEGLFIVSSNIDVPFTDKLRSDWALEKLIVPASAKQRLRYELYRLGVHRAALFPDLDGLTAYLQYQHSVHPNQIFD
jgi:FRG domain